MEELEALDKEAIEKQYVESYRYTTSQKVMASGCAIIMLIGLIVGAVYLVLSIINAIVK